MRVYVVFNPRYEWFELFQKEPVWDEDYEMWLGRDYLETIAPDELPEGVARKAKHSGKAIECHARIDVKYEYPEEEGE